MKKGILLFLSLLAVTAMCVVGCSTKTASSTLPPPDASSVQSGVSEVVPPASSEVGTGSADPSVLNPGQEPVAPPIPEVTPSPETGAADTPPADPSATTPDMPVQPETPLPVVPDAPAETPEQPTSPVEPSVTPPIPVDPPAQPEVPAENTDPTYVYHEKIPILMYHEVNDLLANSLYLSVSDFVSHLDYFEAAGITPISMQQLYDHWFNGAPVPEKPVVLTFDDGYRSMYTTVFPLLKERGWSGTFYCITAGRWSDNFVTAEMIAEMAAGGMEIGSHTDNHVELDKLSESKRASELTKSKSILETITGQEITALCYPAGKYNDETEAASADAGYLTAVTTKSGIATKSQGMFALRRIRVSTDCGAAWIKSTLSALGY